VRRQQRIPIGNTARMNRYIGSCALALALGMTSGATLADTSAASASPVPVPALPMAAPPMAAPMREVILVRHGHYLADPSIDEGVGPGLSTLGFAQARLVGARLQAEYPRLEGLHVSPMQRARDTVAAIAMDAGGKTFEVIDDLAECTPPSRREEVMAEEDPESMAACKAQLDRLFETLFADATPSARADLHVCHGNVIRYLVTRALGVDTEAWLEMSVGHASITRIRVEGNGRYKVIAVGDVGHLPAGLRTGAAGDPERVLVPAER
jgi:serine/threonine-protein phosphatase PGAM5